MGFETRFIVAGVAIVLIINAIIFAMPITVFDWHRRIQNWPRCSAMLDNVTVDKDLTPSWKSSAQTEAFAVCDDEETYPILLKYPAEPQSLNYASADSTNAEVATWNDILVVHVNTGSASEDGGRHLAFINPPDITSWVIATVIICLAEIAALVALFFFSND